MGTHHRDGQVFLAGDASFVGSCPEPSSGHQRLPGPIVGVGPARARGHSRPDHMPRIKPQYKL